MWWVSDLSTTPLGGEERVETGVTGVALVMLAPLAVYWRLVPRFPVYFVFGAFQWVRTATTFRVLKEDPSKYLV